MVSGQEDSPEEGEIVSDELEDISDDSITFTPCIGKSNLPNDTLCALSLSSVSDLEEPPTKKRVKRRKSYNRRHEERKRRKKKEEEPKSSDSEEEFNRTFKLRLKAAVRISNEDEHRKSLKSRLRAMVKDSSDHESLTEQKSKDDLVPIIDLDENETSSCVEVIDDPPNAAESSKSDDIDRELLQLRLEALQTAINNKYLKNNKRKKATDDTNKENTSNNLEKEPLPDKVVVPLISPQTDSNVPVSPDEDEDVLRAVLLASISKKITEHHLELPKLIVNKVQKQQNKIKSQNFKLNNVKSKLKLVNVPQVKPLIIHLDRSDSDSDWALDSGKEIKPQNDQAKQNADKEKENAIENTIDKFLKEQRAKVEEKALSVESNRNKIVVNNIAKTKTTNNLIVRAKQQLPIKKTLNKNLTTNKVAEKLRIQSTQDLEKSVLRFLPANKREEYRNLQNLLKTKKAEMKRLKPKKVVQKTPDNTSLTLAKQTNVNKGQIVKQTVGSKPNQILSNNKVAQKKFVAKNISKQTVPKLGSASKTLQKNGVQLPPKGEARLKEFQRQELEIANIEEDKKKNSAELRTLLRELQSKGDSRLQIQEKYSSLRPLVKILNQVNKEQKHCEQEVDRLILQLGEARKKQGLLYSKMLQSIKQLAEEKQKIDSGLEEQINSKQQANIITSTPTKSGGILNPSLSSISCDVSSSVVCQEVNSTESTLCNNSVNKDSDKEKIILSAKNKVEVKNLDPISVEKGQRPKYISPLDRNGRRNDLDPFAIFCPFEVNGVCKDPNCAFNHMG